MKIVVSILYFYTFQNWISAQPTNNFCSNAIPLCPGLTLSGTTTGASATPTTDYNFCTLNAATVWYKFTTGSSGGFVTVSFSNLTFNPDVTMGQEISVTMISASTECDVATYTPMAACGSGSTNFNVTSAIGLSSNTTYFVQINGINTGAGVTQPAQCDFDISITGDIQYQTEETISVCYGSDYTYPDGTTANTITSDLTHNSNLVSVISGCDSVVITNLDVQPQVNIVATQVGVTFTANSIVADYQWVDCDDSFSEISGATNQSYTATQNGHYACVITENGCSDTTTCFEADFTGIIENNNAFLIYPNPAQSYLYIVFENTAQENILIINDTHGKQILTTNISGQNQAQIETAHFAKGIYFAILIDSDGRVSEQKFVVE